MRTTHTCAVPYMHSIGHHEIKSLKATNKLTKMHYVTATGPFTTNNITTLLRYMCYSLCFTE
jgi:hypothetical protein